MRSRLCRIPDDTYNEILRIANDLRISFPDAHRIYLEKQAGRIKWVDDR